VQSKFGSDESIIGAEVGVWEGETSEALLQRFNNLVLFMVDPWEKVPNMETMHKSADELKVAKSKALERTEFAKTRRIIVDDVSVKAIELVLMSLDFVFIDANHTYDYVKQDIQLWYERVRPGGIVSGHDYGGRVHDREGWGVKRAVDEFTASHGIVPKFARGTVWWFVK
jgi:hypothetical protein